MKKIGAFEAKTQLSRLLKDVEEREEEMIITNRGKPVAVLISYQEYEFRKKSVAARNIIDEFRMFRRNQSPHTPVSMTELKEMIEYGRKY